jgi:hypothetical protein
LNAGCSIAQVVLAMSRRIKSSIFGSTMNEPVKYHSYSQPVRQIIQLYKEHRLKLDPSFQRNGVWKDKQRVHLMASIFQGYPIPSIFVYRHEDEDTGQIIFEVIDGKQRIESLLMYTGQKKGIFAAPVQFPDWDSPRDLSWNQLRKMKKQSILEEYQVQTIEVTGDLSDIIELFVRINSTGNALTPQEIRNANFYRSEFLKAAKKAASKYESYLRQAGIVGIQQIRRMKHIELMSELIFSANLGGVGNKKRVVDSAMRSGSLKGVKLVKALAHTVSSLNRLKTMFPGISRSIRFSKLSDFYSLAVLIQTFEERGLVLTDKKKNAFSAGVDELALASKKLQLKTLSPRDELLRQYLSAVREGSDSETNRRKRHNILEGLLLPLFETKDQHRLFSPEQRRILWNTADERVCDVCGCTLSWEDFHADHIKPHSSGGQTSLSNAALLCVEHNLKKGKKYLAWAKRKGA